MSLTVLQAGPIEAFQCEVYEVCFLYYRVVVEVELAQDEPVEVTTFTVTTPHWPWPTEARQTIQQGVYAPNGPYESGCDGARCEVYWGLKSWHRESGFYPAVVAYADAEVVIGSPVP